MKPTSLLRGGTYAADWIKDFYTRAGGWWGPDPQDPGVHEARVQMVERLCGPGSKRILELGCGSGATAAALADAGHTVVAVDIALRDAAYTQGLLDVPRLGSLAFHQADFYTLDLSGPFDVVCHWEGFGLGSDADQRRLLKRIAQSWLSPAGSLLMDVYNPTRPARDAGTSTRLAPLKGVPGSVEMFERCHFDPIHCRWIDEWEPTADPEQSLAQAIRCYSPADLQLLLEGTGLRLLHIEVEGTGIDPDDDRISCEGPLLGEWSYLAQLGLAG